ncbi:hypothetical protein PVAG01_00029 [Phlyctema vagabunda]|uniref:Lytic polysaccharide monooxygenase 9 n=1 Tax=Phlyctema vagabunda TaxID=108571 RepID=A0ABR4PT21_9HELO
MFFTTSTVAVLGLTSIASAHMIMSSPVPYGKSTLNNSPLEQNGSDFPCKQRTGVYDAEGASNVMPLGSTQQLAFIGSAVHGGGSCQVSITYDEAPTKDSTWKVIHSIEGGCPMKNIAGNNGDNANQVNPDTFSYTIPTTLPTGNATIAWTWFNKVGNREMYMNCAPVSLTSSSSKRDEEPTKRDEAAFSALPDMFTANIDNGCYTDELGDLKFPNPGESLELDGTGERLKPIGDCQAASSGGAAASTASASVPTSAAPIATSVPATESAGLPGGVFATIATSAQAIATQVGSASPVVSASAPVSQAPSPIETEAPSSAASPSTPAGTASSGSSGDAGAMTAGSICSPEGLWNCVGGSSFQQCGSGTWSVVMDLAAGTTCAPGQNSNMQISAIAKTKRAIRFSSEHVRRHLRRSS